MKYVTGCDRTSDFPVSVFFFCFLDSPAVDASVGVEPVE
jgi:hypothetical protein